MAEGERLTTQRQTFLLLPLEERSHCFKVGINEEKLKVDPQILREEKVLQGSCVQ